MPLAKGNWNMSERALRLGVNIDRVATVRNARGGAYPDPVRAAKLAEAAGADGITAHLREDRRHISDADIDGLMAALSLPDVAVATPVLKTDAEAYARFREVFSGERWERLAASGARVQRPLWASTSTKNPDYSDLLYVETLIGPHTVNTMPPNTLEALLDLGWVDADMDGQRRLFRLTEAGREQREAAAETVAAIEARLADGLGLKDAVSEAGAVRFLPIALTAGTVVTGSFVMVFDPIFQGLAISLMMGSLLSTVLTVVVIPLAYYLYKRSVGS